MAGPLSIVPSRVPTGLFSAKPKDVPETARAGAAPATTTPDSSKPAAGQFRRALANEIGLGGAARPGRPARTDDLRLVRANPSDSAARRAIDSVIRDSLQRDLPPAPSIEPPAQSRTAPKPPLSLREQIRRYKEDQLLANPGGDAYHTDRDKNVIVKPDGPSGFFERIGKDLKDAGRNFLNVAKNFFLGAEYRYRDAGGVIRTGRHRGLLGTVGKFFQNLASGLSFGHYVPEGETAPQGAAARAKHFFKKVFGEALLNNLVAGVPRAVGHMVKDAALGLLNLAEVIPDATIGNVPEGEKLVTDTFDNAQVALSYAMDILPYGDAWARVNAPGSADKGLGVPILFNLKSPSAGIRDSNWTRVLNTPFRKTIETMGSVVTSALTFFLPSVAFPKPAGIGEEVRPERPRRPQEPAPPVVARKGLRQREPAEAARPRTPPRLTRSPGEGLPGERREPEDPEATR